MDATQRRRIVGILIVATVTLVIVTADLAIGGRADPQPLRAAATLLDGSWRFRTGDDPRWASATWDDSGWETVELTAPPGSHDGDVGLPDYVGGWMAHGHPGYHGYAWYRRAVTVPAGSASWDILGPTLVEDGYELYWNGQLLGGSGRLGPHPRLVGTRPLRFALPADAAGTRGVLAIRAYMLPGSGGSADGGGLHTAPFLAPRPVSDALHRAQWQRTIAGYIADAVEPLAMLALIGLALGYGARSSRKGFLVFACIALALTAARRSNNAIVAWTDLQSLTTYGWLASVMWVPTFAAWVLAWNRWCLPPWRSVDVAAVVLAVAGIIGALTPSATWTSVCRLGSLALFVVLAARIVRSGSMRTLALATLVSIMATLFGSELLDPLGVPGIWFPFGIGVARTQYLYVIVIPLLAILIERTLGPKEAPLERPGNARAA
ncbi:glycoside hydrolase family 2 [Aggregicoccus sp. 17bor-14]|uniref:glycoside hydrolase family 2 n=1 Tax=Myxococcaceae TaxID=31 RepID=UPI00129C8F17|nr:MULTISPECIES: glycoside hydrolase family 2 [Myxococcaceae]MBF5042912.1 glycoside hydrolase family 2 [Simulacricoccus sp. 17bor-14]MRI88679.1 glycoside hydrolase family 2 [Aggregicoccus sp. 17bor-14]